MAQAATGHTSQSGPVKRPDQGTESVLCDVTSVTFQTMQLREADGGPGLQAWGLGT